MRLFLTSILCSLIFITTSYSQKELSLNEAINIALQRNTTLQRNINAIKNYESGVMSAYGNFLPSLSASGSWGWNRSEDEGTTYNIGSFVYTSPPSKTESRSYSADVTSNVTLFDGLANYANLSKSKNDLEAARLSLERQKQDVVFQTISAYYDVLNAQQLLKVKEDDLKWNQKNLETITERNKLGAVTLADVYSQQVKVGNAELALVQAKNTFETAKSNLLYYLGLDVLENYSFTDTLTSNEKDILNKDLTKDYQNISDLVNRAMKYRSDYQSMKLNLESASENVTIARSGHLPSLTGQLSFNSYANSIDKLKNLSNKNYRVGLTLSIPIFSGFSVSERVQSAEVQEENTKLDLTDMERDIKRNIQKTYLDLQAAEKGLKVSEKNVEASAENRKIEQEKYSLGSGTLLDLLIANSDYTNAQTNFIDSQFSYIKLSEQLKYYLGVLDYNKYENKQ